MKKKILALIAVSMLLPLCVVMTGCGNSFDPCDYLKGQMQLLKTGEVTEEALANTEGSKEDLEKDYQEVEDTFVDAFLEEVKELNFEDTKENREMVADVFRAIMAPMTYEVSDEYTEEGDSYFVDITVERSNILNEDVLEKWTNDWVDSHYGKFNSEADVYAAFWPDYCNYIIENADKVGMTDSGKITIEIAYNDDDGYYEVTKSSIGKLVDAVFGN
ncbi:MAG: hypothetical protein Q4A40_03090 [Bacillota bacterium]|nr:hypothetical protein [Bacillota bacterium]